MISGKTEQFRQFIRQVHEARIKELSGGLCLKARMVLPVAQDGFDAGSDRAVNVPPIGAKRVERHTGEAVDEVEVFRGPARDGYVFHNMRVDQHVQCLLRIGQSVKARR